MTAIVIRGDARELPLPDASVDLIVTSPPYFGLRSYTDGCPSCADTVKLTTHSRRQRLCPQCGYVFDSGRLKCHQCNVTTVDAPQPNLINPCPDCGGTGQRHYAGQIGSEATPAEWLANLLACTREWVRVLKPTGSLFVNLGDKYSSGNGGDSNLTALGQRLGTGGGQKSDKSKQRQLPVKGLPPKTLLGLPWRYALAVTDQLGLILRAEIIWAKPNGLPESVTDRVRRAHEQVFHFTRQPRYYSAVDEIREPQATIGERHGLLTGGKYGRETGKVTGTRALDPLGKLPGSVWQIPSQPLTVPPALGVDHFAAFPMELPRRLILGWSPPGICTACGEGRGPVAHSYEVAGQWRAGSLVGKRDGITNKGDLNGYDYGMAGKRRFAQQTTITGYACGCPQPTAPTRPAVVVDPFGGTGTTALIASAYGRTGISIDRSNDYSRLARWRTQDPGERARALEVDKPPAVMDGQGELFAM